MPSKSKGATRTEADSMGEVTVAADALYGAQTQRAIDNFPVSGLHMPDGFIRALILIKQTTADTNRALKLLDDGRADAIINACSKLLEAPTMSAWSQHFPVDVFQTGSGTSSNMNANEVISHLASEMLGEPVSPNDHVNMSQSSNDVIPTAIHLSAALALDASLLPALKHLEAIIRGKADSVDQIIKTGRTHLMDAMPIRMSQELNGWADQILHAREMMETARPALHRLAQGGTAVGSGINAHPDFATRFAQTLTSKTGIAFSPSRQCFASLSGQDAAVTLSGHLKTLATALMKISNDLRWMNSGPLAGLGEIALEALQPGSSIMPGKVNPVIPEAVAMVSAQVIGNDTTITLAGQSGNFQLNVMLPVIAYNLLQSIDLLTNSATLLADRAITTFTVNQDNLNKALALNPILVTALNSKIGYLKAAEIAKKAYKEGRPIIDVAEQETDLTREELQHLLDPAALTQGGIPD
ncbi:class II fumarate hydratase [Kistimonas asteriae]|uniref:class II fumarate hydratase n=1 Tax=Kistimonas asteriae TaxID=517724 RepID=UPI001BAA3DE4|nr:class II fumarate hydratase [Kistimonas asteriae]